MSTTPHPHTPGSAHATVHKAEHSKTAALLGYLIRGRRRPDEVTVVSHSDLFYWWPVWLVGFVMFAITSMHGVHAAFVTGDPKIVQVVGPVSYKVLDDKEGAGTTITKNDIQA